MVLDVNRHHNPWLPIRDKCTFGKRLVGEVEGGGVGTKDKCELEGGGGVS